MTYKKRKILIVLAVAVLALALCAVLFAACGGKHDDGEDDGTTTYGEITVLDDGVVSHKYSLAIGSDVYTYMQGKISDFDKEHAQFDHFEYEGEELASGLSMTSSVTLTAIYQIEITLEINAKNITGYEEWQDDGDYTHIDSLDVRYYAFAGTSFTADVQDIEGLTGEEGKNSASARTITVASDYTRNIIPLYYERDSITVRRYANYPADSGMADVGYDSVETYFGYPVELPSGYACNGYLMLGWSSRRLATYPDYAVDSVSAGLMVWNDSHKLYEPAPESAETVVFYPTETTPMYVVWGKGYTDLFGSGDVVYILEEDADVAYLYRGGVFYESTQKIGELYYFANASSGTASYYRLRLSDNYTFAYYDESRVGTYYEFYYTWDGTTFGAVVSSDYILFSETDEFVYYVGNSSSRGIYRTDGEGYYHLTYKSGSLEGQTATIVLAETESGANVFMFVNEDEANMGLLPLGVVVYDEGLFSTYYYTDYYYLALDGMGDCLYYLNGSYYTYYYFLDGDTLDLFTYYYYSYYWVGTFKRIMTDSGEYAWFLYDSDTDGTFNVYDGDELIGTVECDGYVNAIFTATDGTETSGLYYTQNLVIGWSLFFEYGLSDGTTACKNFVVSEDSYGDFVTDDDGNYIVKKLSDTYAELYRYDENGLNYDMLVLDCDGEGTCAYVIVAYDYYGYGYYYTVLQGTYKIYESSKYPGLEYYIFTVDTDLTPDLTDEFYYYIYVYYSALDISEYPNITQLAFVRDTVVYGGYYQYSVDIWMWYDVNGIAEGGDDSSGSGEDAPWATDTSVTYFEEYELENFEFTFVYGEYGLDEDGNIVVAGTEVLMTETITGTFSAIILDGGLVFGAITVVDGESPDGSRIVPVYGFIYGTLTVDDKTNEAYTATCLYLEFDGGEQAGSDGKTYYVYAYTYVYLKLNGEETTEVTDIPVYIYEATIADGPSDNVYLSYNGISRDDELTYTYFDGQTTYTGTIAEKEGGDDDPFGNTVFTFTSEDSNCSFDFVYMYYGYETMFMVYDSSEITTYKGEDGSTIVTDPLGYQLIYTDARGDTHTLAYSYFNMVLPGEGGDASFVGQHGVGYIQLLIDGELVTVDLVDKTSDTAATYDYTVRGTEFGWYYLTDNLLYQYVMILDGYGSVYVYDLDTDENGEMVLVGNGTYEITDTYIYLCYTLGSGGEQGAGTEYEIEAEVDLIALMYMENANETITYMAYGGIYINHEEYTGRYISYVDMAVLELGSNGTAIRYCSDGEIETGVYTWLDENYFYYVNDAGTYGDIFYVKDGYNVREENYSSTVAKYFNADMSKYIEFTSNGRVTFDNGHNYHYYVVDDNLEITVYYVPDAVNREYANKYGYLKYKFGALGATFTATATQTTYYNILWNTDYLTLGRRSGDESKYNYEFMGTEYALGEIMLYSYYTDQTGSYGVIYMADDDGIAGYMYTYLYFEENTEKTDENDSDIVIYMYVGTSSSYYYYGYYYDYLYYFYKIEVDLESETYVVTDEKLYLDAFMYEYMYYTYYGYSVADYYYSYLTFEWNVSENGVATENAVYGYVLPYMYYDVVDGTYVYRFEIDGAGFTVTDDIFYVTFEGGDGETYELQLYVDYSSYWNWYYGYYSFVLINLWQPEHFEYTVTEGTDKYTLGIGYVIYSSVYYSGTLMLDFHVYNYSTALQDYTEVNFDTVEILLLDRKIYYMVEVATASGVRSYWYEISIDTNDEENLAMTVEIEKELIVRYYLEDSVSFVDVYVNDETNEIIMIYTDGCYYTVGSCEYDETAGYTVVISTGTYTVVLTEGTGGASGSATMTRVED